MYRKRVWLGLFVALLVGLWVLPVAVLPVAAQDGETEAPVVAVDEISDDEVNDVAKDLYCPVCENTPLDVCPTQACADWRELIRTKLAQGDSKQDIFNYFALQYGDSALAQPPRTGVNLILWLLPFVAVGLGLIFFARYMRGLRHEESADGETAVSPEPAPDDYAARIEEELKNK